MRRLVVILIAVLIVLAAGGLLVLGAFPPHPHPQAVEHTLPNSRFSTQ